MQKEMELQYTPSTDIGTSSEFDEEYEERLGTIRTEAFDIPDLRKAVNEMEEKKATAHAEHEAPPKQLDRRIVATVASLKALTQFGFFLKTDLCSIEEMSGVHGHHLRSLSAMQ